MVTSVKHVADIMSEITAASQEQSAGIGEINQAITQMDEMTQQNAALVEQAAAAAESMQDQAAMLAQAVSVFKLDRRIADLSKLRLPSRAPVAAAPPRSTAVDTTRGDSPTPVKPGPVVAGGTSDEWEEF